MDITEAVKRMRIIEYVSIVKRYVLIRVKTFYVKISFQFKTLEMFLVAIKIFGVINVLPRSMFIA